MKENQRLWIIKEIKKTLVEHNRKHPLLDEMITIKDIEFVLEMVSAVIRGKVGFMTGGDIK